MKRFTQLYHELEKETEIELLHFYFAAYAEETTSRDVEWAIHFLRGGGLKRLVSLAQLADLAREQVDFSSSIFEACVDASSDLIETISLVIPQNQERELFGLTYWIDEIQRVKRAEFNKKLEFIRQAWKNLQLDERYFFNRIITNSFRSPISQNQLVQVLATFLEKSSHQIAYSIYHLSDQLPNSLVELSSFQADGDSPFPIEFIEPHEISDTSKIGVPESFTGSFEWNGVRTQWIVTSDESHLWTRRGELVSDKFPEFRSLADQFNTSCILDGVLMAHSENELLPKSHVRNRIKRKRITNKIIFDNPVYFCAFDILKIGKTDLTARPYIDRRKLLEEFVQSLAKNDLIKLSDDTAISTWDMLDNHWNELRLLKSHALILKKKNDGYTGDSVWYKYKAPAFSVQGVVLYVKRGEGSLANSFTEYTLGARIGSDLIPFTKVTAKFNDEDTLAMKAFVKNNTIERFGPVYSLEAKAIFEITYEAIEVAKRRKSGLMLKNPLFIAWHRDGGLSDVVRLETLKEQIV